MTTAKIDTNDPRNIWVTADNGTSKSSGGDEFGTYENPFTEVATALKRAAPGSRVVLLPGVYVGDETFEISGGEHAPIYITAYESGAAVVEDGCWYFYDACDLVVSGVTFKHAKRTALSVVGACLRNRFHSLKFVDCGTDKEDTCTFYFGGTGARFNIVEDCEFIRAHKHAAAGLMISDGGDGDYLTNHIVRYNKFDGYARAIIVGAGNSHGDFESGHVVERNLLDKCGADGITVKCRDVLVRDNVVKNCKGSGVKLDGGGYSVVSANTICKCGAGVSVVGAGHTVCGNTIAACDNAINSEGDSGGLIIDENIITQDLTNIDDIVINRNDDNDNDDSYATAIQSHDDEDENENGEEKNSVEEIDILEYMFHLDEE